MKPMKTVVIDKRKWSRGPVVGANALLIDKQQAEAYASEANPPIAGRMCCLGFVSLALGATKKQIRGKRYPAEVNRVLPGLSIDGENTPFARKAAQINDDESLTDNQRMLKLREFAAEYGFNFIFV